MHIEIRLFPGTAGQGGRLAARRSELETLFRELPGLRSFDLAETREGLAVIAAAEDPREAAEGVRWFTDWLTCQLPDLEWRDGFRVAGVVIARLGC